MFAVKLLSFEPLRFSLKQLFVSRTCATQERQESLYVMELETYYGSFIPVLILSVVQWYQLNLRFDLRNVTVHCVLMMYIQNALDLHFEIPINPNGSTNSTNIS